VRVVIFVGAVVTFVVSRSAGFPGSREISREIVDSWRSPCWKAAEFDVNPAISSQIPAARKQGIRVADAGNLVAEQGK